MRDAGFRSLADRGSLPSSSESVAGASSESVAGGPNARAGHLTKNVLKPAIDRAVAGMPSGEWRENLNAIAELLVEHGHHL